MAKEVIKMSGAANLPLSPGIKAGDFIFVSGHGGFEDPKTKSPVTGIKAQTNQCLENIELVLKAAGASKQDVVKVTVFLVNGADFAAMNEEYRVFFTENPPARSTVVTSLVIEKMLIEIECIAYRPGK